MNTTSEIPDKFARMFPPCVAMVGLLFIHCMIKSSCGSMSCGLFSEIEERHKSPSVALSELLSLEAIAAIDCLLKA